MIQIIILFIFGYVILGAYFESINALFIGFLITVLFGISSVGLGIIIASFSKTPEIANGFSLTIFLVLIFISGSLIPFESIIVYFTPPFWAKQVYLQVTLLGHEFNDKLYSSSLIGYSAKTISIPLWGGILIVLSFTLTFIILGIIIFQKKTNLG